MRGRWIQYSEHELKFIYDNQTLNRKILTRLFNERYQRDLKPLDIMKLCQRNKWTKGNNGKLKKPTGKQGKLDTNSSLYKKGCMPHNTNDIGHEFIRSDGFIMVKIQNNQDPRYNHKLKHQIIWEKHNGPKPANMLIAFIDGNPRNCIIENLELIQKSENLLRNKLGLRKAPQELKPIIKKIAKLSALAHSHESGK